VFIYCGAKTVSRGATRLLLHILVRSAKADACGRSFAVLPTQVSTGGLPQQAAVWNLS
jgi:hypothetical protein